MYKVIPAIYENGIFKPLKRIHLKEHQRINLRMEIPKNEYESLKETLDILSDKEQIKRLYQAIQDVKKGKLFSHQDVFGHSQPNL